MEKVRRTINSLDDVYRLAEFNEQKVKPLQIACPIHGELVLVEYANVNGLPIPTFIGCCEEAINNELEVRLNESR